MRHFFMFMFAVLVCIVKNSDCMDEGNGEDEVTCDNGTFLFDMRAYSFPETHQCKQGDVIDLECPVCGTKSSNAKIEWLMNDKPPNKWPRPTHREFKGFQLKIKECEEENAGNYTCMVHTNDTKTEKLSHTFQVHVLRRLLSTQFITEKPQNATVKLGDSWSFQCPLVDPSLEVHYYRNVNLVTTNYNTSYLQEAEVGNSTEYLHFAHVSLDDEGWYSCHVLDQKSDEASASAYLTVTDLSWFQENKTLLMVIGTAVFCFCAAVIVIPYTCFSRSK